MSRRHRNIRVDADEQAIAFFRLYAEEVRSVMDLPVTLASPHWAARRLPESNEKVVASPGLRTEEEESEPRAAEADTPADKPATMPATKPAGEVTKPAEERATPEEAERQILSLASHPRFPRFRWTDGDGSRIVHREGPQLAIDRNASTIRAALDDPEDAFESR